MKRPRFDFCFFAFYFLITVYQVRSIYSSMAGSSHACQWFVLFGITAVCVWRLCVFVFLPQDLKNKEKAERNAREQVAEAQHASVKDEIAKQVGC